MAPEPWPILLAVRMPHFGGCERDMTRVAVNLDRAKFQPHVGCFYREGMRLPELEAAGIPVAEFPLRSYKSASSIYRAVTSFITYVRRHNIQLVRTYDSPSGSFLIPLARYAKVPVLIASQLSLRELSSKRERLFFRYADRSVNKLVVNSKAVLEDMAQHHDMPREKIDLIYNGVDSDVFQPGPRVRPPELEGSSMVIGSVAVLREEKRLHLLVQAFAEVKKVRPGVRLLMVGGGYEQERLQQLAQELHLGDSALWVGTQTNVADWMRAMDVLVLPSRSESFPNSLLEGMASGCCPVGSMVGGIPELIENEKSGLLFPSGDANALAACLIRLVTDDQLWIRLARAATERAHSTFSLERFITKTSLLYEGLISQHHGIDVRPVAVHS